MATEVDPRALDAVVRARKVKRHAELLEQARGTWTWRTAVVGICLLAATWLYLRITNFSPAVLPAIIVVSVFGSLSEARTSKRIDAILQLLEEADQSGAAAFYDAPAVKPSDQE